MANEAVKIQQGVKNSRRYTVADATQVSRGTLLVLTDPNTVTKSAVGTLNEAFAGIASEDHPANLGITTIGAWTDGDFDLTCNSGTGFNAGALVSMSGANMIRASVAADILAGAVIGKAQQTASASEVVRIAVGELV